jgi:hypothetical protein
MFDDDQQRYDIRSSSHIDTLRVDLIQLSGLEEYCDVEVYCKDGGMRMNRLFLGLLFPEIKDHGAVYLPDYTEDEIQKSVNQSIAAIKKKDRISPVFLTVRSPRTLLATPQQGRSVGVGRRVDPGLEVPGGVGGAAGSAVEAGLGEEGGESPPRVESPPTTVDPRQMMEEEEIMQEDREEVSGFGLFNGYQMQQDLVVFDNQVPALHRNPPIVSSNLPDHITLDDFITPRQFLPAPRLHSSGGIRRPPVSVLRRHSNPPAGADAPGGQRFIQFNPTVDKPAKSDEYYQELYKDDIKKCDVKVARLRPSAELRGEISKLKHKYWVDRIRQKNEKILQRKRDLMMVDGRKKELMIEERKKNRPKKKCRCQRCENCLVEDCMTCVACLDMRKYGGPQRLKQACRNRPKCVFLDQGIDPWGNEVPVYQD